MTPISRITLIFLFLLSFSCSKQQEKTFDLAQEIETQTKALSPALVLRDTIPARAPIPAKGRWIDPDSVAKPTTISIKDKTEIIRANANVHPAGTPKAVQIPKDLTVIIPGKDGALMPKKTPAQGKAIPRPKYSLLPASPPVFKDAAATNIRYLDQEQGLKHSNVYSILEDSRGGLWFGMGNGASRYDGASFNYFALDGAGGVRCMLEDSQGVFWFGTELGGVVRYDGQSFIRFTANEGLSGNLVWSILEDSRGDLWFGGRSGVSRYDPSANSGQGVFTHYSTEEGLSGNEVGVILEDSRGDLWFGTDNGASRYDPDAYEGRGSFTHYTTKEGLNGNRIWSILEDSREDLWFGTGNGASRYDPDAYEGRGSFTHYTTKEGLSGNWIRSILEDSRGDLWFGTDNGASRYDPLANSGRGAFTHYSIEEGLSSKRVLSILEDNWGNLWFATVAGGVNCFSRTQFTFYSTKQGLVNNIIRSLLEDSRGNLWIGALGEGVSCFDGVNFTNYAIEKSLGNIRSLLEDSQGNLWFGGDFGINRFDGFGFTQFTINEGLNSNLISSILEDRRGNIWFGTRNKGVSRYDGKSFTWFTTAEGLSSNSISAMLEDRRGNIWFGTDNGASRYDPDAYEGSGSFIHYTAKEGLSNNRITSILEDKRGNLWLGTERGLNRLCQYETEEYDPNPDAEQDCPDGSLSLFTMEEGLSDNSITSMLEDSRGFIWIGTNNGVNRYDPDSNIKQDGIKENFVAFTAEQGLVGDHILGVKEDKQKNIWIGTSDGISLLIPAPGESASAEDPIADHYQVFSFDSSKGFKNIADIVIDRQNRMWLGSNKGVTLLDLKQFSLQKSPPVGINLNTVAVEGIFIDYRRLKDTTYRRQLAFGEDLAGSFNSVPAFENYPLNLSLPHRLNHLTFHFSAIDGAAPNMLRYSYFLEGFDKNWSQGKTENKADYRKLPPGSYTFKVKAVGAAQKWSDVFEYTFRIQPPWWLSWWAKTLYILTALAVLYGLYAWGMREQRKKIVWQEKELARERQLNEQLKKVDQIKDQFLANTSHELRTPLQGIIGLSEFWQEKAKEDRLREDMTMITSSGKRLSNLVNEILDFSKLKNYDIELLCKPVNLRVLADIVLKNNAPLVKGKDLELINAIPTNLPSANADENRLQQILYNLVGNAIKFTETGCVKISAVEKEKLLQISVEDTGAGIPENKLDAIFQEFEQADGSIAREFVGTGLGLSISKRLVELHEGRMWVESEVGRGSTFFFTLPVSKGKASAPAQSLEGVDAVQLTVGHKDASAPPVLSMKDDNALRILVVDDEPINQQVLKNHLSGKGFQLTQAMNGEEAIKAIQNQPSFDLVLLDVMMPRMSGYEVCRKIREKYLLSELPVIMVTAKDQLQDVVQGLSLGANDYLSKPFHKEELLARINTQLDLRRVFDVAGRFVPNEFLRSLNRERITEVVLGDHTEREVTVLFTDIRAYTTLAETMTPEENFNFVNAFHGRMGPVIQKHGGFVNQYLGDAIMAIFPEKPKNALEAAIEMQEVLREYNLKRQAQNRQSLRIGVGLHTGPLIMGVIGDRNRMDAATIADTVNTASRIESLTKHYGASILLSEDSLQKMQSASEADGKNIEKTFHLRNLGKVRVKGKKEPVGVYECYNGDAPAAAAKKLESIRDFEKGFAHFFAREFPEASAAFNQVLKRNPTDQTARLFLNKSSKYTIEGVQKDWTGVEIMTFK